VAGIVKITAKGIKKYVQKMEVRKMITIKTYDEFGFAGIFVEDSFANLYYCEIDKIRWEQNYLVLLEPLKFFENLSKPDEYAFFTVPEINNIIAKGVLIPFIHTQRIYFTDKTKEMLKNLTDIKFIDKRK